MAPRQPEPPAGFELADIYFVLFRHKWKIILFSVLGIAAAAAVFFLTQRTYTSQARILVRYVVENASVNPADEGDRVKSPDSRGDLIINSEIQILTSHDLLGMVADVVGPERLLASSDGNADRNAAIGMIYKGLKVEVPPKTTVIAISYAHPDRAVAQRVLQALVEKYRERHVEIHRAVDALDFLDRQTTQLRQRLAATEDRLRQLRTNSTIISFDDARQNLMTEMTSLRAAIRQTEVDLETRKATLEARQKWITPKTNATPASPQAPIQDLNLYRSLVARLDGLRLKELELLGTLTEENPIVIGVRSQIAEMEKRRRAMEEANPELALAGNPAAGIPERKVDLVDDMSQVVALKARLDVLNSQWDRLREQALALDRVENDFREVERRKSWEEESYRYFSASLEKARIDQQIDASKVSNISVVQNASPAALDLRPLYKLVAQVAGAGIALGIALAFLIEFAIDHSVKRPADFKKRVAMPLVLTIPRLTARQMRRSLPGTKPVDGHPLEVTVWDPSHPLRAYFEALRDRVIVSFDGDPRRPKFVGVTSCSRKAGSSSLAAGLAASLSETGDGNVLLVDLNMETGSAHEFFRGKPACELHEAVEDEKRQQGQVQENLYLARIDQVNGKGLARIPSKKIAEIIPRLKTSDYDYIIFDMPPISQTSITFRMSAFMDRVLLVTEAEKTHRGVLQEAHALLQQSKASVFAVLNKHRQYVPKMLHQELNGAETR